MSTGQMYSGKGDSATLIEGMDQKRTQTVDSNHEQTGEAAGPIADLLNVSKEPQEPISLVLPPFLAKNLTDPNKAADLIAATQKVFDAFHRSNEYPYFGYQTHLAYKALEISLIQSFEKVANQLTGPLPDREIGEPENFEENPFQPEAYDYLMRNPYNYTDMQQLQDWVHKMQGMMQKAFATLESLIKVKDTQSELTKTQSEALAAHKDVIANQKRMIELLERQVPGQTEPKPDTSLEHSFSILTGYSQNSQAEILFFALTEYRDKRKVQYLQNLQEGDHEAAFNEHSDYQTAQNILDELTLSTFSLANSNYLAGAYKNDTRGYRSHLDTSKRWNAASYKDFCFEYVQTEFDGMDEGVKPATESTETPIGEAQTTEPTE